MKLDSTIGETATVARKMAPARLSLKTTFWR
jgi:hypothetical protein